MLQKNKFIFRNFHKVIKSKWKGDALLTVKNHFSPSMDTVSWLGSSFSLGLSKGRFPNIF